MSAPFTFDDARPMAQHCAALLGTMPAAADRPSRLPEAALALAAKLAPAIGGLLGGAKLRVACPAHGRRATDAFFDRAGARSVGALFAFPGGGARMVAAIGVGDLLALTDQMFGGAGEIGDDLPEELPLTADIVASQIEEIVAEALFGVLTPFGRPAVSDRGHDVRALKPFGAHPECFTIELVVSQPGLPDWAILLAACPDAHATLFGQDLPDVRPPRPRGASDRMAQAASDVPFDLRAVIAELSLPLARLSTLRPGDIVPLSIARDVPLRIGDQAIAYGTVGAVDDQVSLQLTRVF